jgi:hypothetical protein
MGPVEGRGKTVEGQDHLEYYFSLAHDGKDRPSRVNSSLVEGLGRNAI